MKELKNKFILQFVSSFLASWGSTHFDGSWDIDFPIKLAEYLGESAWEQWKRDTGKEKLFQLVERSLTSKVKRRKL